MRGITAIARRELLSFFVSPVAYFVITGFTLLCGYFFFNLLGFYNLIIQRAGAMPMMGQQLPDMNQWLVENYFHTLIIVLVFLIPFLTMRLFAEEKRRGTFELLVTSPLSVTEIVLGKFLGTAVIITLMAGIATSFPLLLSAFANPGPEVLMVLVAGVGVLLCGLGFAAIAMSLSSLTENQIVAGISAMVVLLLLYVIQSAAESATGVWQSVLQYLAPSQQLQELFKGVITSTSAVYFISLIVIGIFFSQRTLEAYRYR